MKNQGIVESIERTRIHVPFHPRCREVKDIRVPDFGVVDLFRIRSASGVEGVGENLPFYGSPRSTDDRFGQAIGHNVFDLLSDDSLGVGIQMALYDLAGKLTDLPCHRLLGHQHRDACPVSWWAQDMKPEEWAREAKTAESMGFTSMKAKARPWFDIEQQLEAVCEAVPSHFKLDVDFNGLLLGEDIATPLLRLLESRHSNFAIVESPIPQSDVAGNALLRQKIDTPIAMHFGTPPIMTAIREAVCDGFVVSGGAAAVTSQATVAEHANMPFWLQLVGTGLTTLWSVHLGAVLKMARWPYIPCINVYENPLITDFTIEGGHVPVPEAPGLGVTLDEDAVERYRVDPEFRVPARRQIHSIRWPSGRTLHYPDGGYRGEFLSGALTGALPGITLDRRLDDDSEEFDREYKELFG